MCFAKTLFYRKVVLCRVPRSSAYGMFQLYYVRVIIVREMLDSIQKCISYYRYNRFTMTTYCESGNAIYLKHFQLKQS